MPAAKAGRLAPIITTCQCINIKIICSSAKDQKKLKKVLSIKLEPEEDNSPISIASIILCGVSNNKSSPQAN